MLSLRWYLLAQRHPLSTEESELDLFVHYWVAFEALTMDTTNVKSAEKLFESLHGTTREEVHSKLQIGRLQGLRSDIVHKGLTPDLDYRVLILLDALYVDALAYKLNVTHVGNTDKYMDGTTAVDFLP